ncbi:MAG: RNA polymerase sigma factor [Labilithrix sp.]|nr:RNA polymerase sigma factor [Labilithrix sp.]
MATLRDPLVHFSPLAGELAPSDEGERERARTASHAAITRLYAEHGARIHRFLRDLLGDAALAADATQETFVRAYRSMESLREGAPVAPWLFGIARNVSLEIRRARFRARRVITAVEAPEVAASGSPESEAMGREAVRIVAAALEHLSDDRKAMLLLRLDHALSYEAIAELMGFSVAKVKVEIFRAREVLRSTMADYERGGAP